VGAAVGAMVVGAIVGAAVGATVTCRWPVVVSWQLKVENGDTLTSLSKFRLGAAGAGH